MLDHFTDIFSLSVHHYYHSDFHNGQFHSHFHLVHLSLCSKTVSIRLWFRKERENLQTKNDLCTKSNNHLAEPGLEPQTSWSPGAHSTPRPRRPPECIFYYHHFSLFHLFSSPPIFGLDNHYSVPSLFGRKHVQWHHSFQNLFIQALMLRIFCATVCFQ